MTLRQTLSGDAYRVHELVDQLLDSEDSLIVLVDRRRAISYAEGFGLSPCQLELVANEIERTVRSITTARPTRIRRRQILSERDDDQNWKEAGRRAPASTDTATYGPSVSAHHSCCSADVTR